MSVHADLFCHPHIFAEGVGGHGKDRDTGQPGVRQRADRFCRLVAVHDRHLDIHQYGIITARMRGSYFFHSFLAVRGCLHDESGIFQKHFRNFPIDIDIVHKQKPLLAEIKLPGRDGFGSVRILRLIGQFQCQADDEFGPFPLFRDDFYRSVHQIQKAFRNGHTEPCSLDAADRCP